MIRRGNDDGVNIRARENFTVIARRGNIFVKHFINTVAPSIIQIRRSHEFYARHLQRRPGIDKTDDAMPMVASRILSLGAKGLLYGSAKESLLPWPIECRALRRQQKPSSQQVVAENLDADRFSCSASPHLTGMNLKKLFG
jgi:hypothetical protein